MKLNKKSSLIIFLLFACLLAVGASRFPQLWLRDSGNYLEYSVQRSDLDVTVLATGTVLPENRLEVKVPISGRMDEIYVQEGQRVKQGEMIAKFSTIERATLLDAAMGVGPEELKKWKELFRPIPILAPLAGTIISRNIEPGQTFRDSDAIFVMSDRLTIKAQVDETDLAQIKLNQVAEVILDAFSDVQIPAKVQQVAFEARTVSNVTTYIVNVLPKDTPEFMRSGMTANVKFFIGSKGNILLVPNFFIRQEQRKSHVLVQTEQGPVKKNIQIGLSDGKMSEVLSGLNEGDVILVNKTLENEQKLKRLHSNSENHDRN
jgi:macrolide-specific efflux system membrane fusion protein